MNRWRCKTFNYKLKILLFDIEKFLTNVVLVINIFIIVKISLIK